MSSKTNVDPELLYYELRELLQSKGLDIPSEADDALADACEQIASANNA